MKRRASQLHMQPGGNPVATKDVADPADVLSAAGISLAQAQGRLPC